MDFMTTGWILLGVGALVWLIIARRRFYRRGVGGLQQFRSFGSAVITTFLEWLFRLVAVLCMITGLLYLIAGTNQGEEKTEQARIERKAEQG